MKKILLTVLMLSILIPVSVFAAAPSDEEVFQATTAVLSIFGLVFMSSMFGTAPEGVEMDMNMETGYSQMIFDGFNVQDFTTGMAGMMESADEELIYSFSKMSGTVEVDEAGNLNMDVDLTGSNIKNLIMKSEGEDIVTIKANGKAYNHLAAMLMAMDDEM